MHVVGWCTAAFLCKEEAYFVWCIQCSLLIFSALSFHPETTQHSSFAFDLPLQCVLCWDIRGIYTKQACGSGSAENQHSLIVFSLSHSTFSPSCLLPLLHHRTTKIVQWMCLPACQSSFNPWQMQGVLIIYIWFSTLPQEGLKKTRELGGRESVEKKMNDTQGVDRRGQAVRSVVKRKLEEQRRRQEVQGLEEMT